MNAQPEFPGVIESFAAGVENIFAKRRTKIAKRRVSVPNVSANFRMQMMVSVELILYLGSESFQY